MTKGTMVNHRIYVAFVILWHRLKQKPTKKSGYSQKGSESSNFLEPYLQKVTRCYFRNKYRSVSLKESFLKSSENWFNVLKGVIG